MTIPRNGGQATSRDAFEPQSSRVDDFFDGDNEEVRAGILMSIVVAWVIVNAWDS